MTMAGRSRYLCFASFLFLLATTAPESTATATAAAVSAEGCEEVYVGAGWGGVYSFYRRIVDDPSRGPKACLFEESWRIGGRTYSVQINHTVLPNFVQDIGAYRFSPDMHLPGDLILHDLDLDTVCYSEDCPSARVDMPPEFTFDYDAPLRRIVDPKTRLPIGYVTPMSKMLDIAKGLGGRVFMQTPLVRLTKTEGTEDAGGDGNTVSLEFQEATNSLMVVRSPSVVVLNLPRHKLLEIEGVEASLEPDTVKILKCHAFDIPDDLVVDASRDKMAESKFVTTLEKAYLYYSDAWWRTVLHKPEGFWPMEYPAIPSKIDEGLLFNIRFHDGPVSCDGHDQCHGLLQIYYDSSNETVYSSTVAPHSKDPLGSVWNTDGPVAEAKLSRIHAALMDVLHPLFREMGIDDPRSSIDPPSGLIVGVWNQPTSDAPLGFGYTAPTKVTYEPTMSGYPDEACGVSGLTDATYREIALQPWRTILTDTSIFLVNNDWVCKSIREFQGDWAEESLLQAERAMYLLGTSKPSWLDEFYYQKKVESIVGGNFATAKILGKRKGSNYRWYAFIPVGILAVTLMIGWYPRKLLFFQRNDYTAI